MVVAPHKKWSRSPCIVSMLIIYPPHEKPGHGQSRIPRPRRGAAVAAALRAAQRRVRPVGGAVAADVPRGEGGGPAAGAAGRAARDRADQRVADARPHGGGRLARTSPRRGGPAGAPGLPDGADAGGLQPGARHGARGLRRGAGRRSGSGPRGADPDARDDHDEPRRRREPDAAQTAQRRTRRRRWNERDCQTEDGQGRGRRDDRGQGRGGCGGRVARGGGRTETSRPGPVRGHAGAARGAGAGRRLHVAERRTHPDHRERLPAAGQGADDLRGLGPGGRGRHRRERAGLGRRRAVPHRSRALPHRAAAGRRGARRGADRGRAAPRGLQRAVARQGSAASDVAYLRARVRPPEGAVGARRQRGRGARRGGPRPAHRPRRPLGGRAGRRRRARRAQRRRRTSPPRRIRRCMAAHAVRDEAASSWRRPTCARRPTAWSAQAEPFKAGPVRHRRDAAVRAGRDRRQLGRGELQGDRPDASCRSGQDGRGARSTPIPTGR